MSCMQLDPSADLFCGLLQENNRKYFSALTRAQTTTQQFHINALFPSVLEKKSSAEHSKVSKQREVNQVEAYVIFPGRQSCAAWSKAESRIRNNVHGIQFKVLRTKI